MEDRLRTEELPLHDRFIQLRRVQHKDRYVCFICQTARFPAEDVFWDHVRREHAERLPASDVDRAAMRRKALQPAIKHGRTLEPVRRVDSVDSMRANPDAQTSKPPSPSAPDLGRLSLEQKEDTPAENLVVPERRSLAVSTSPSSRKRPASSEAPSPVSAEIRAIARNTQRPISDPNSARRTTGAKDDLSRPPPRRKQLFDPSAASQLKRSDGNTIQVNSQSQSPRRDQSKLDRHAASNAKVLKTATADQPRVKGVLSLPSLPSKALYPDMILQPDSRPISNEQLAAEVKGIYAGLVIVEAKCISMDNAHVSGQDPRGELSNEQWQTLTALHRTLLYEHHDFLLASQHPSASSALKRLAQDHSMPFRMWKHAIHAFLEVLRQHLPQSMDYMLNFIYLAYQMMALLYETVPLFETTWTECLGDLARYRMAIENEDMSVRDTWSGVARYWYSKSSDHHPSVGRLYHHLGILARPYCLQQIYYYCKSLTCVQPFWNARESITSLFDPLLGRTPMVYPKVQPLDTSFAKLHALMFAGRPSEEVQVACTDYCFQLDAHIGHKKDDNHWKLDGACVAVANVASWLEYGSEKNGLRQAFMDMVTLTTNLESNQADVQKNSAKILTHNGSTTSGFFWAADPRDVTFLVLSVALRRSGDKDMLWKVLPHVHVILAFFYFLSKLNNIGSEVRKLLSTAPWTELSACLNALSSKATLNLRSLSADVEDSITKFEKGESRPLPEDYLMQGLVWCQSYFPADWFSGQMDEEARIHETPSSDNIRAERVLRIGIHLSNRQQFLHHDRTTNMFSAVIPKALLSDKPVVDISNSTKSVIHQHGQRREPAAPLTGRSPEVRVATMRKSRDIQFAVADTDQEPFEAIDVV